MAKLRTRGGREEKRKERKRMLVYWLVYLSVCLSHIRCEDVAQRNSAESRRTAEDGLETENMRGITEIEIETEKESIEIESTETGAENETGAEKETEAEIGIGRETEAEIGRGIERETEEIGIEEVETQQEIRIGIEKRVRREKESTRTKTRQQKSLL